MSSTSPWISPSPSSLISRLCGRNWLSSPRPNSGPTSCAWSRQRRENRRRQRAHLRPLLAGLPAGALPLRGILAQIDLFLAQTDEDQKRLVDIGAPGRSRTRRRKSQFDAALPEPPPVVEVFAKLCRAMVLAPFSSAVARSKAKSLLLGAFENVLASHPHAVMILAPRHPERFVRSRKASSNWESDSGADLCGTANPSPAACCYRHHRRTRLALCSRGHRVRRRKPGSARRSQHSRARPTWSRHRGRKPYRKFSRYHQPVPKP